MTLSFFQALVANPFLQSALLAGIAIAFLSGMIGTFVVIKRISFITGSISHAVLGGIGASLYLQKVHNVACFSPLLGALIVAIFCGLIMGYTTKRQDSVMAVLWSFGMAVGILFMSQTPGYNVELSHFMIGNLLWTSSQDLWVLLVLNIVVVLSVFFYQRALIAISFDEAYATLRKVPTQFLNYLLLALISITVVLAIQVVGVILVLTLLSVPASIASIYSRTVPKMMLWASFLSCFFFLLGLYFSYHFDTPPGATIALISSLSYGIALLHRRLVNG